MIWTAYLPSGSQIWKETFRPQTSPMVKYIFFIMVTQIIFEICKNNVTFIIAFEARATRSKHSKLQTENDKKSILFFTKNLFSLHFSCLQIDNKSFRVLSDLAIICLSIFLVCRNLCLSVGIHICLSQCLSISLPVGLMSVLCWSSSVRIFYVICFI